MVSAFTIWCTGLPKSGKSALADALAGEVRRRGLQVELIHSGRMRKTPLGANLGFSRDDRDTNVRRHAFAANLLVKNGVVAIVSAVSPYSATRAEIRAELNPFVEVYVSTPKAACIERDRDGVWDKALNGEIRNFTGVDARYEPPDAPEVEVDLAQLSIEAAMKRVLAKLELLGLVQPSTDSSEDDRLLDPLRT